jgi:4-hydroxy-2-oxoheptanedioate aldolase
VQEAHADSGGWRGRPRETLAAGAPVLGTFVKSADPQLAEILALAGFGVLVADLEHSTLDEADVAAIVRAAELHRVPVVARIGARDLDRAGRLLETGAIGIQVTGVEEPSTLEGLHRATRFPPAGARSLALSHRGAGFGQAPVETFLRGDAACLLTVAQIESRAAVAALPELLAGAHGPDVWFIGPFDLSADLGRPGEVEHAEIRAVVDEALDALRDAGAAIGAFARDGADARDWRSRGAQLILISSDVMLLAGSARNAANALG